MPDGVMTDWGPALGELRRECAQRQIGCVGNALQQPRALGFECVRAPAAHRLGLRAARCPEPLRPLHDAGYAEPEPLGHGPARLAGRNSGNYAFSEIEGVGTDDAGWPPLQPTW